MALAQANAHQDRYFLQDMDNCLRVSLLMDFSLSVSTLEKVDSECHCTLRIAFYSLSLSTLYAKLIAEYPSAGFLWQEIHLRE